MRSILVPVLLALAAVGCGMVSTSTRPITKEGGVPVPAGRVYQPELALPAPGNTATVLFLRDAGLVGGGCTHRILVDGKAAFGIRAGEYQTLHLAPGQHVFALQIEGGVCPEFFTFQSTILADSAEATYRISIPSPATRACLTRTDAAAESARASSTGAEEAPPPPPVQTAAPAPPPPPASAQSGPIEPANVSVSLHDPSVVINGSRLEAPTLADVERLFGKPDRVEDLASRIHVFDRYGITAYEPHNGLVTELQFYFVRESYSFVPKTMFRGRIEFDGQAIAGTTLAPSLHGLQHDTMIKSWKFEGRGFTLFVNPPEGTDGPEIGRVSVSFPKRGCGP